MDRYHMTEAVAVVATFLVLAGIAAWAWSLGAPLAFVGGIFVFPVLIWGQYFWLVRKSVKERKGLEDDAGRERQQADAERERELSRRLVASVLSH